MIRNLSKQCFCSKRNWSTSDMSTVIFCIFLTFPARFNHKFDEVQACRQEIAQILDQKLSKQGLSSVSKICFSVQVTKLRIAFILGEGLIFKTCVCFLLKENPRLSSQKMEAKMAALRTERQARSKVSSIGYSVDH